MAVLPPIEEIASLRTPKQIFTTAYLNDPIKFNTDARLSPESLLEQVQDYIPSPRDFAQFIIVDLSSVTNRWCPVTMYTSALNRADYETIFANRQFTQLI